MEKLKCFLGLHKYKKVFDSEEEKWKNGRRPIRISMGGFTEYICEHCKHRRTKFWSAFD